ncbi:DUF4097 family beta strand repeat-containing protein [Lysobacter humi (ex Lee et al. 2017)]
MNTPTITLLATALLLAGNAASAATPINESRPLDARGRVEVENVKGRIEVRAWDRAEVRIEGSLGKGVERLEIQGDRGVLRIKVKYPSRNGVMGFALGDSQSEPTVLRLMVPVRADLDIAAVSADVLAWGVAPARLQIENVSGNTTVAAAPDSAEISSVSGDLDLTLNRANVNVESVSGDIRLSGRLGGEIEVETVSGDLDLNVIGTPVEQLQGTSVSGDMRLRTAVAARARMTLESVSGDIDLRLPSNVSADVRAESFSGSLRAPNATVERPPHGPGANLRKRYGSGDADISIETFSGDAELRFD